MERGRRPLSRYTWVVAFLTWLVSTIPLCQNSLNHWSLDCGAFPVGAVYTYVVGLWQFTFKTTANHTTPLLTQWGSYLTLQHLEFWTQLTQTYWTTITCNQLLMTLPHILYCVSAQDQSIPLALLDIHNIRTVHEQTLYNKYCFDYRLSIKNAIIVLLFKFGLLYRCHHLHLAVILLKCGVV